MKKIVILFCFIFFLVVSTAVFAHIDNLPFLIPHYGKNFSQFDYNSDNKVNLVDIAIDAFHIDPSIAPHPSSSASTSITWPTLSLTSFVSGLATPIDISSANDGTNRLFVVEQGGKIKIIKNGQTLSQPFLNIANKISCCGERGLLGLAFPPNFAQRKRFYVNYTNTAGNTVIARYWVDATNPDRGNESSEEIILTINQPYANHNGGHIAFGPDGYLYIGMGDGGSGGDPQNHAQNKLDLLGKMLRIDPESVPSGYKIPSTNPFIALSSYKPEIWALGLRNPWKFSFDRITGSLYIADVGQNNIEEVNFQSGQSSGGENYGWRIMEGDTCYNPSSGCNQAGLVKPITQYTHAQGCSITGGFVYRGEQYAAMKGIYFYSDYCSGRIWGAKQVNGVWESKELINTGRAVSSFGEGEDGALYVNGHSNGTIYKIVGN